MSDLTLPTPPTGDPVAPKRDAPSTGPKKTSFRWSDPNWVLILIFVGILAIVPIAQTVMEAMSEDGVMALELFGDRPTAENLRAFEHKLEGASWAGRVSRPWLQYANFAWLGEGGEKVVVGRDGWYFFRPGLKYMLARPESAQSANPTND